MPLSKTTKEELVQRLWNCGVFLFGDAAKAQYGINTPVFIDFRGNLYDDIDTLRFLGRCIADVAIEEFGEGVKLIGVPDTGTPLAVCASVVGCLQLAVLRKTIREQGPQRRSLMGIKRKFEKRILVDDVMASGVSKMHSIARLHEGDMNAAGIVVVVNRSQGGDHLMESLGYPVKALLSIHEIVDLLVSWEKLGASVGDEIKSYLASRQYTFQEFWNLLEEDPVARALAQRTSGPHAT